MIFRTGIEKNVVTVALIVLIAVGGSIGVNAVDKATGNDSSVSEMVSPEYIAAMKERVKMLSDRLMNSEEEYNSGLLSREIVWKQRMEQDTAKLMLMRLEGKRPREAGLAEFFIQLRYAETYAAHQEYEYNAGNLTLPMFRDVKLALNQAKLNYLNQLSRVKNKEALTKAIAALAKYPNTPAADADLKALLAVE